MAARALQAERARRDPRPPRSGPPRVLAIVVTHNGREWLKECLVGLANQTYRHLDVLVVDDASLDSRVEPTLRRIAKRHLRKRRWGIVRTPRPLGFGGAINWALSRVKTDADFLLFVHDDAALYRDALERLVARMQADPTTAAVGPKVVAWDDPRRLEEVGMAIDSFGYPYKGLEDNEIDLGQHDQSVEVFYITSTCMLLKHDVFRDLRGWDAGLRAFSEDLDLCWRARIAGYSVRVEPAARVRHAIALATDRRRSPFKPQRYFIRRNRLRTIAKNVSGPRLLVLFPLFFLLSLVEMLGFVVLRQFREIPNLGRALLWNFFHLPQTLSERSRVQRKRKVPDRGLRWLMVREATRMRTYVSHQTTRLEEAWGRGSEFLARRDDAVRVVGSTLRGRTGVIVAIAILGFLIGFRHLLWGPPAAIGELLPFPERATGLWRAFVSPWRSVGLGQPGDAPPAYFLLGAFQLVTFGVGGAAQKLLILALAGSAFAGAYRLVAGFVDRPSRIAAGAAYALGAIGYAGIREGALGALVFGAVAPFAIQSMLRLIGWVRPAGWVRGREVARVALAAAVSAAFVPGATVVYLVAAALLTGARYIMEGRSRPTRALRGFVSCLVGLLFGGFVMLLPWSGSWFSTGGVFDLLLGDDTYGAYARGFSGHGVLSVLLGQTPDVPALYGLALPLLGAVAVVVGMGQRRRVALALWLLVVADAWIVGAISNGLVRPFVASPPEAGVLGAVAFAGLVGLAVGAFRLDLPRRGLGLVHALTLGSVAVAGFLVVVGVGPALWRGAWGPGRASNEYRPVLVAQLNDLLTSEAAGEGTFRALWVGDRWASPTPSAARPARTYKITGPAGEELTDLFERRGGRADAEFETVLASIEEGKTDRGGGLLAAFNVRFVVLERGPRASRWLAQRDLALIRSERDHFVLENQDLVARAAVYPEVPPYVRAVEDRDPTLIPGGTGEVLVELEQRSSARYATDDAEGPGAATVTEAEDTGWSAALDGDELDRVDGGWANAFDVPETSGGHLVVRYPRTTTDVTATVAVALVWVVIVGGAFSRRRMRSAERKAV